MITHTFPMSRRIVLTGGLSGGHTYPLIAVARALRTLSQGVSTLELRFIGTRGPFEEEAMQTESISTRYIWSAKWRRYFSFQNFIDCFKFPISFLQALWHLFVFMPDAVFSKGGAASVPVVFAARLYRIPVMLHDSDAVAGRANRIVGKYATRVAIAYEHARQFFAPEKTVLTGNPIRSELLEGNAERGREALRFFPDRPVLLVLGGSLGAKRLNEAVLAILPELLSHHIQVIHITGSTHIDDCIHRAGVLGIKAGTDGYVPLAFVDAASLADYYALATLILSRAGAGIITEIAAVKRPAILVPLTSAANDEQRLNAYEIAQYGGALVIEEQNLGPHMLTQHILELLSQPDTCAHLVAGMQRFYHPEAAETIARGIISML